MFNSVSWQEFFLAIAFSVSGYYCLAALVLFRAEILSLLKPDSLKPIPSVEASGSPDSASGIMGEIEVREESSGARTSLDTARDIEVYPSNDDPEPFQEPVAVGSADSAMLIGSVADLLQEIKTLVDLVSECKSPKEEGVSLFQTLLLRYPHLRGSIYQEPITLYIYECARSRFPFGLEPGEIAAWWNSEP